MATKFDKQQLPIDTIYEPRVLEIEEEVAKKADKIDECFIQSNVEEVGSGYSVGDVLDVMIGTIPVVITVEGVDFFGSVNEYSIDPKVTPTEEALQSYTPTGGTGTGFKLDIESVREVKNLSDVYSELGTSIKEVSERISDNEVEVNLELDKKMNKTTTGAGNGGIAIYGHPDGSVVNTGRTLTDISTEINTAVATHNSSVTAHADIRALITDLEYIEDVSYNQSTGDLLFTYDDGTTLTVNILIADLVKDLDYDDVTRELIVEKEDGTEIRIPIADLVDIYEGFNGPNIQVTIESGNIIKAVLKNDSIAKAQLNSLLRDEIDGKLNISQDISLNGKMLKVVGGAVDFVDENIIFDASILPSSSMGELGQYCITPYGIYKKEMRAEADGWNLSCTTTGDNPSGDFVDMGVNVTMSNNGGNPISTHWFYNEDKQYVLVWNSAYSGYWWMNKVNSPYGPSDIEQAKRNDNGSATYYTQITTPPATPQTPPPTGSWSGMSASLNSLVWTLTEGSGAEVPTWVLYSKYRASSTHLFINEQKVPMLQDVISTIVSNDLSISVATVPATQDTGKTLTMNVRPSTTANNALMINSGAYVPAERLNLVTSSVSTTTYAWNMTTNPYIQLTATGASLTITTSYSNVTNFGVRGKMMLINGSSADRTVTINPSTIKWTKNKLATMKGSTTYLIEIWTQGTNVYGDWEVMDNVGSSVSPGLAQVLAVGDTAIDNQLVIKSNYGSHAKLEPGKVEVTDGYPLQDTVITSGGVTVSHDGPYTTNKLDIFGLNLKKDSGNPANLATFKIDMYGGAHDADPEVSGTDNMKRAFNAWLGNEANTIDEVLAVGNVAKSKTLKILDAAYETRSMELNENTLKLKEEDNPGDVRDNIVDYMGMTVRHDGPGTTNKFDMYGMDLRKADFGMGEAKFKVDIYANGFNDEFVTGTENVRASFARWLKTNNAITSLTYTAATSVVKGLNSEGGVVSTIDLPLESLIKDLSLDDTTNELVLTKEDGSVVRVPLNALLVGVVKNVNGIAPNSSGRVDLKINDVISATAGNNLVTAGKEMTFGGGSSSWGTRITDSMINSYSSTGTCTITPQKINFAGNAGNTFSIDTSPTTPIVAGSTSVKNAFNTWLGTNTLSIDAVLGIGNTANKKTMTLTDTDTSVSTVIRPGYVQTDEGYPDQYAKMDGMSFVVYHDGPYVTNKLDWYGLKLKCEYDQRPYGPDYRANFEILSYAEDGVYVKGSDNVKASFNEWLGTSSLDGILKTGENVVADTKKIRFGLATSSSTSLIENNSISQKIDQYGGTFTTDVTPGTVRLKTTLGNNDLRLECEGGFIYSNSVVDGGYQTRLSANIFELRGVGDGYDNIFGIDVSKTATLGKVYGTDSIRTAFNTWLGTTDIFNKDASSVNNGITVGWGANPYQKLPTRTNTIAIGFKPSAVQTALGSSSVYIGGNQTGDSNASVLVGYNANAASTSAPTLLGASTKIGTGSPYSVAIGANSEVAVNQSAVVSFGNGVHETYGTRRLVNVSDPIGDQDAVTKKYLMTVIEGLENRLIELENNAVTI